MKLAFTMQTTGEMNMCNKYAPGTESSILNVNNTIYYIKHKLTYFCVLCVCVVSHCCKRANTV